MKKLVSSLAILVLCAGVTFGQVTKVKEVIAAGASDMRNATLHLQGTIGQAVIGPTVNGSNFDFQGFWTPDGMGTSTGVKIGVSGPPADFQLLQNYPNPFNPTTTIDFSVPSRSKIVLRVFSMTGSLVKTLINETYDAGTYSVVFTAGEIPTGSYLYTLEAGGHTMTKRMILIK